MDIVIEWSCLWSRAMYAGLSDPILITNDDVRLHFIERHQDGVALNLCDYLDYLVMLTKA